MSIAALSATAFSSLPALAGTIPSARNAWNTLGQKLTSGDMDSARNVFAVYKRLTANTVNHADTQFVSDLNDLGSALATNSLSSARTAYQNVSSDMASDPVLAIRSAAATAQQTASWISTMIGLASPSGNSQANSATSPYQAILSTAYDRLSDSLSSGTKLTESSSTGSTENYLKLVYGSAGSSAGSSTGKSSSLATSLLDLYA